ncbi:deoxynucleoside monophosphate kinase [Serratia phage 4S]|nr:deoxynucleoside monophosphate kinase [Serratia phage 4S]
MKLIAVFGGKRSGKDTIADHLVNHNGIKHQLAGPLKELLHRCWYSYDVGLTLDKADFEGTGIDREKPLPISNKEVYEYLVRCAQRARQDYGFNPYRECVPFPGFGIFKEYISNDEIERHIHELTINNTEAWTIRRLMQTLGTDICVHFDKLVWVRCFASAYIEALVSGQYDYFIVPDIRQEHESATVRKLGAICIHTDRGVVNTDKHITEQKQEILSGDIVIHNTGTIEDLYEILDKTLGLSND